jgi:hypothetical protein
MTCAAIVGLSACGSQPTATQERDAAIAATTSWVDNDDCEVLSDRYAEEWGDTAEEGRKECAKETYKGLQRGQYSVSSASVSGATATVNLNLRPAGTRTYKLVKPADAWFVDNMAESFKGGVGDTFTYRASFEENDRPIEEEVLVKVASVKDPAPPPELAYGDRGKKWIRAQVKMTSKGPEVGSLSVDSFQLVDNRGHRYDARGYDYKPSLGNNSIELSARDSITGFVSFLVPKKTEAKEIRWNGTFPEDAPFEWMLARK